MSVTNALNLVDGTSSITSPSTYAVALSPACGWWYCPPTGGEDSPYRLGDFRDYNADATCIFDGVNCPSAVTTSPTSDVIFTLSLANGFVFSDFESLSDYHFGVILRNSATTAFIGKVYGTNAVYIEKSAVSDLLGTSYGSYDVIPVVTAYANNTTHVTEATCIPLPCAKSTITYSNASTEAGLGFSVSFGGVTATAVSARMRFTVKFTVYNETNAAQTVNLSNLYFKIKNGSTTDCSDYTTDYISCSKTDSISIAANSQSSTYTSTLNDSLTNYTSSPFYYKVIAYYNTASGYKEAGSTSILQGSKDLDA
jgi:hypothetical protein